MIISLFDIAQPLLRDVFATWDDWHGELQTVTGYSWAEYEALQDRLADLPESSPSREDEEMLRRAAGQFFGYPAIRTENLEDALGPTWADQLNSALRGSEQP